MDKPILCAIKECQNIANQNEKYLVIPTMFVVPNSYLTCDEHKDVFLDYYYFYDDKGKNIWKKIEVKNESEI